MKLFTYETEAGTRYGFRAYVGMDEKTGKRKQVRMRGFATQKDAEIAYLRVRTKPVKKEERITVREVYEEWFPLYQQTVRSSTQRKTGNYFTSHILPVFGNMRIAKITVSDVQQFILEKSKTSVALYRQIKIYFSKLFDFAIRQEYLEKNPFDRIIMPKVTRPRKSDDELFYTREELAEFLAYCKSDLSDYWYTFFRLVSFTGLRRGEALALRWEDVDFESGEIHVIQNLAIGYDGKQYVSDTKTEAGQRILALDKETLHVLKLHRISQKGDLVFPKKSGGLQTLSAPLRRMGEVIEAHNLKPLTLHGLRHTHCSLLLMSGVPIKEVQRRMGHSDIKTTLDVYAHVSKSGQKKVANAFASFVADGTGYRDATIDAIN